ncbi:hypothetical protein [Rhodococcus rhodnii]|nr:hypothetical protein [Rhodococcus rhodnii]
MSTAAIRRGLVATLAAAAMGTAALVGAGTAHAQPTSTTMTCGSANPLFWAPQFTWTVTASSGESLPPGGDGLEPSLLLSGDNTLPNPPAGLFPHLGPDWYGTRVIVDWHNTTTGASGQSFSDEEAWKQKPGIPVNRAWTGTGSVDVTVTVQTGAGWWWFNPQNAVCTGTVEIVPGRG